MALSAKLSIIPACLCAALAISCSQAEYKNLPAKPSATPTQTAPAGVSNTALPSTANTASPPMSGQRNLPPEGGDKPTSAEYSGYLYSYKKDGEKTIAAFEEKTLPWDTGVLSGAVRDVILRSYGDSVKADLRIEGTGPARTIRIAGSRYQYVIVPVSEANGAIRTLIITRQN